MNGLYVEFAIFVLCMIAVIVGGVIVMTRYSKDHDLEDWIDKRKGKR